MYNTSRRDQIFNLLENRERMSVAELADYFHVTQTTIRRDLILMEEEGQIVRKRGFAILPEQGHTLYIRRRNVFMDEKKRIAKKAFELCRSVHSMAFDSGTTIAELVHLLVEAQHDNYKREIVTCSLQIAYETSRAFHTYVPGGLVFPDEFSVSGTTMQNFFQGITADIAFLGSTGVRSTQGLTISYLPMMDVKRSLMECATKRVALLDSSKFQTRGLYTFCRYDELDTLITVKTEQNAAALDEIAKHNVQIILA